MYLKKLELQGFKSFADKTTLEFKPGVTVVMGPNGSGKSNISDAVRWVLGEQSIKTLRGSKLEDVIFAGTQARKSVSFAEVDITIDNQDGKLPIDYSEVTVTRRVYRSGDSEFFINKNACRLKDIVELFMDTGIGRDGYSIIGQGRIDEILSTKSEDRRHIFEEAAGIVKYRTRKEESEKKLENTRQNLTRINDIFSEIEKQLGPLENQAETAKKFLDIREKLKYLEVGLYINNINKNKEKLNEILDQVNEVTNQITDEEKKLENLQGRKEEIKLLVEELIRNIEEEQGKAFEAQNNIEKQKADIAVCKEKKEHNLEKYENYKLDIEKSSARKIELEQDKEDRKNRKLNLAEDKKRFETELHEKEAEYAKLSENMTTEQKKIEDLKEKIMNNIDLKFEKMQVLTNLTASLETGKSRINQISEEVRDNIHELDKERMVKEDELVSFNKISADSNKLTTHLEELNKMKSECNAKTLEHENNIKKISEELHIKESRYKFLVETEREFEGYNKAVKDVLSKCQKESAFGAGIHGALASLIKVPSEYETAIEMVLGASIQNIVTETEDEAKRAIAYLKENNLGRASFLPISAIKGGKLNENFKGFDGVLGVASDLISYDKKYENVVQNLLGRTVIVNNMDTAVLVSKKYKYSFRIVTLEGDIVNASGQMTGGSVFKKTTSILSRSREISELEKVVIDLKKKLEKAQNDLEEYKSSIEVALSEFEEVTIRLQQVNIELATETQKMKEIENNIERFQKKISLLNGEKEKIEESLVESKKNSDEISDLIKKAEAENEEMQKVVDEFSEKNKEQQEIMNDLNSDIVDLRISVSSFDESADSIDEMIAMIDEEINNCEQNVKNKTEEREKLLEENKSLDGRIVELEEAIKNVDKTSKESEEKVAKLKEEREVRNKEQSEVESGIESEFKTLEILRDQNTKLDVRKSKLELDIETIQNKMWEEYETTPNTAKDYAEVTSGTAKEVEGLKTEIRNLGPINVNAIDEYKALKDRYDFLNTQKTDLEESEKSLNKIIEDMVNLMKIQFAEQFDLINKNFSEVFAELFGGGYANLRIADESNILESGIEIDAQPPGKKLQSMMLLSGGERALTAIALLFAILKLNPSPFCILDEIEAALDDVNVYRYADYLKKFSEKTQFLVITHRKGTQEVANTIYGVTMQEHGVSKLLSLNLE